MTVTKEHLATEIDVTDWLTLRAHLERGGIIIVNNMLDLTEVGFEVASDDVKTIERWIASGLIGKPTAEQIDRWDGEKAKKFLCLIVSPFVLVQEQSPEKG